MLYVNQPSHFLPLAQEAKKLAKKIKAEEKASQWSGIAVEQLLNNSFTEQLNCIQSLQQIVPLHAAKDHLQLLPVTNAPDTDAFLTVRSQITFFQQNHFDEICSVVTYIANATHILPTFPNLPVTITPLPISEAPILYQDQQLQELEQRITYLRISSQS